MSVIVAVDIYFYFLTWGGGRGGMGWSGRECGGTTTLILVKDDDDDDDDDGKKIPPAAKVGWWLNVIIFVILAIVFISFHSIHLCNY